MKTLMLALILGIHAQCGLPPLKPVPPLGCKDTKPQCECDREGHCHWIFVCVPEGQP